MPIAGLAAQARPAARERQDERPKRGLMTTLARATRLAAQKHQKHAATATAHGVRVAPPSDADDDRPRRMRCRCRGEARSCCSRRRRAPASPRARTAPQRRPPACSPLVRASRAGLRSEPSSRARRAAIPSGARLDPAGSTATVAGRTGPERFENVGREVLAAELAEITWLGMGATASCVAPGGVQQPSGETIVKYRTTESSVYRARRRIAPPAPSTTVPAYDGGSRLRADIAPAVGPRAIERLLRTVVRGLHPAAQRSYSAPQARRHHQGDQNDRGDERKPMHSVC